MTGLTNAELAAIRDAIETLLPDTCNVMSSTNVSDGQGGWTQTRGTVSAGVNCRLDWRTGMSIQTGGAVSMYTGWVFSMPYDTTVNADHEIDHGGYSYSVKGVDGDKSWNAVLRVLVDRI